MVRMDGCGPEYTKLRAGMYLTGRRSLAPGHRDKLAEGANPIYAGADHAYFVTYVGPGNWHMRDCACNNFYPMREDELDSYEVIQDWHEIDVDPTYINEFLMDAYADESRETGSV